MVAVVDYAFRAHVEGGGVNARFGHCGGSGVLVCADFRAMVDSPMVPEAGVVQGDDGSERRRMRVRCPVCPAA